MSLEWKIKLAKTLLENSIFVFSWDWKSPVKKPKMQFSAESKRHIQQLRAGSFLKI
jgi:hypothetical protein